MKGFFALAAAALLAVDFGPPEPVETGHGIAEFRYYGEQVGVDAAGNAFIGAKLTVPVGDDEDEQAMVLRRCGTTWSQSVVAGSPDHLTHAHDLAVASGGAAVLVWSDEHSSADSRLFASYRPAGGDWGAPEPIAGGDIEDFDVDISDAGAAAVIWATGSINSRKVHASYRPASGGWEAAKELAGLYTGVLAVSGAGEVAVVGQNGLGGDDPLKAYIRAPGQPWPAASEDVPHPAGPAFSKTDGPNALEYDGAGRLIVLDNENNANIEATVRANGAWSPTQTIQQGAGAAGVLDLARHPDGAVAAWRVGDDLRVARFNGTWDTPKTYAAAGNGYATASLAADDAGNIVVAAARTAPAGYEVWTATATGIGAPLSDMTRLSPAATADRYYEHPAAGGGKYLVVAYSVRDHGALATVATASGTAPGCTTQPPPDPSATPTADPPPPPPPDSTPQPLPAQPTPTPAPKRVARLKFANFVKASGCTRRRTLAVTFKVPRGQSVSRIELRVNRKRAALRKAPKIAGKLTLRKLPKRFRLEARVTLKSGSRLNLKGPGPFICARTRGAAPTL
jgi:hypothetical protein